MSETETVLKKVMEAAKDYDVFYSDPITLSKSLQYVQWGTDNVQEFLAFAKKAGVKTLYLHKGMIDKEGSDDHKGELSYIEVGF